MRVRLIYQKRYGACFVPHIALAAVFSRSALRAGLKLMMTQGFSPRARLSFGPELPAGVVALNEPVDMYLGGEAEDLVDRLNASLPEGFRVNRVLFPDEDAPNLGKFCSHAEYLVRCEHDIDARDVYSQDVVCSERVDEWFRLIVANPAQNPIGRLVKHLVNENIIAGWHQINIVRMAVGMYHEGSVAL